MREARKMSLGTVAKRAGFSGRQGVHGFERQETSGRLEIRNIRKLAKALDCDFIYFLVPRPETGRNFTVLFDWLRRDPESDQPSPDSGRHTPACGEPCRTNQLPVVSSVELPLPT